MRKTTLLPLLLSSMICPASGGTDAGASEPVQEGSKICGIVGILNGQAAQNTTLEVNDELGLLERAAEDFLDVLGDGGRLCVITFHSLEDRIIKNVFQRRADPCTCPPALPCVCGKKADIRKITRKPVEAGEAEREANPRARSAKLRVAEKIETGE